MKRFYPLILTSILLTLTTGTATAQEGPQKTVTVEFVADEKDFVPTPVGDARGTAAESQSPYTVGVDDVLEINVLQPETLKAVVTVSPDGTITYPYIGSVKVKGLTVPQVEAEVQKRLADGYLKYPVVSASLQETRSRKFFVYGEVLKPGPYMIEENMTVLRAISMAGGFTRFGSSSRVKVLRPKASGTGYDTLKVNINEVMKGITEEDIEILQGDIVVVSEGVF
jgi:polysaccharide biosynthesis/export protein